MIEFVLVNEMIEERLVGFFQKEVDGFVDYFVYCECEGFDYVDLNEDVEIYFLKKFGCFSLVIEGEKYVFVVGEVIFMFNQL